MSNIQPAPRELLPESVWPVYDEWAAAVKAHSDFVREHYDTLTPEWESIAERKQARASRDALDSGKKLTRDHVAEARGARPGVVSKAAELLSAVHGPSERLRATIEREAHEMVDGAIADLDDAGKAYEAAQAALHAARSEYGKRYLVVKYYQDAAAGRHRSWTGASQLPGEVSATDHASTAIEKTKRDLGQPTVKASDLWTVRAPNGSLLRNLEPMEAGTFLANGCVAVDPVTLEPLADQPKASALNPAVVGVNVAAGFKGAGR